MLASRGRSQTWRARRGKTCGHGMPRWCCLVVSPSWPGACVDYFASEHSMESTHAGAAAYRALPPLPPHQTPAGGPLPAGRRKAFFCRAANRAGRCFPTDLVFTFFFYQHVLDVATYELRVPLHRRGRTRVGGNRPTHWLGRRMASVGLDALGGCGREGIDSCASQIACPAAAAAAGSASPGTCAASRCRS